MSIDEDLIKDARSKGINISGTLNELLRNFLKPKKANFKKEDLTLEIIEFGKSLNLSIKITNKEGVEESLEFTPEMSVFTHENSHLDATIIWENFKRDHNPKFSLFDYIEIRKKFRDKFKLD